MRNLKQFMKTAREMAQNWTSDLQSNADVNYPNIKLGVTVGQVLRFNSDHHLEMRDCWMLIEIIKDQSSQTYRVAFRPLLSDLSHCHYYPDEALLNSLTNPNHNFGSKTIIFRHDSWLDADFHHDFDLYRQIRMRASQVIPSVEHTVCENNGNLVVKERSIFNLSTPIRSYLNDRGCIIREYDQLSWIEPSHDHPVLDTGELGSSDWETLYMQTIETDWETIIVPTIWLKDRVYYECFLDFHANWHTYKSGRRITGKVGNFVVAHWITISNKLMTSTSLRLCDSTQSKEAYI